MLKIDASLQHVAASREQVVTLLESVNRPLVNIPATGTSQTRAYVIGMGTAGGAYRVFVYLIQPDNGGAVTIYVSDPPDMTGEQYRTEESEAVRFLESMGFVMDDRKFRGLDPQAQLAEMKRVGAFMPPRLPAPELAEPAIVGRPIEPMPSEGPSEIFGGFSAEQQATFRRAGMLNETGSQTPQSESWVAPERPTAAQDELGGDAKKVAGDADRASLARLGRLLSSFGLLFALALPQACVKVLDPKAPIPAAVQTQVDIGNQQLGSGSYAQAVRTFEDVLAETPHARDAVYGLGVAYFSLGRPVEAEQNLRRALELDPKWSNAKNTLAILLIKSQRCAEAEPLLEEVLNDIFYSTPDFAEHNLARAIACQGRNKDAVNRLDKLLVRRPEFCLGYLTLADISTRAKMPELTIKACEGFQARCEAHEQIRKLVTPEHSCQCNWRKGMAHAALGDVESARSEFLSCQSSGPFGRECRRSLELLLR